MSDVASKLLRRPRKIDKNEMRHFPVGGKPNELHQIDTLHMPDDEGYNYMTVIVDVNTRKLDAEPLKSMEAQETAKAIQTIYERGILRKPKNVQTDAGTEFKKETGQYFRDNHIHHRVGKTARHKQQGIVENRNGTIARKLFARMTRQELITGKTSTEWVDYLGDVIAKMNRKSRALVDSLKEKRAQEEKDKKDVKYPVEFGIGDKVRVIAEEPRDVVSGKREVGSKFRATDLRWDPEIRIVKDMILDGQIPLYVLNHPTKKGKLEMVGYYGKELQKVDDDDYGDAKEISKKELKDTFIAEKVIDKKKVKNATHWLVKWRGYNKNDATWEPNKTFATTAWHKELIEDFKERL